MKIIIPGFLSRLYLWVLRQFTEPCNTTLINYYMGLMWESNESPVANEKYNHLSILIPSDSPVQSLSKFSIYIGGAGGHKPLAILTSWSFVVLVVQDTSSEGRVGRLFIYYKSPPKGEYYSYHLSIKDSLRLTSS